MRRGRRLRRWADGHGPRLVVRPSKAASGDTVTLRCDGYKSGPWGATLLMQGNDGSWTPIYALHRDGTFQQYPLPQQSGPVGMPAVAVSGPIQVKVPPVEPGGYRIERGCFSSEGPITQHLAVGYLTVVTAERDEGSC